MAYLHNFESFSRLLDFSIFTAEKSDEKVYQLPCLIEWYSNRDSWWWCRNPSTWFGEEMHLGISLCCPSVVTHMLCASNHATFYNTPWLLILQLFLFSSKQREGNKAYAIKSGLASEAVTLILYKLCIPKRPSSAKAL